MNTILLSTTITLALCGLGVVAYGQTFSEWFRQKKTRLKYLRQQVAALSVFRETVREGYEATEEELDSAAGEEQRTVEMDEEWLSSLGKVKEVFKESDQVRTIYHMTQAFINASETRIALCKCSPWLIEPEKEQFEFDLGLVKMDMQQTLKSLLQYITDGQLEMTDAERWRMIDELMRHVQLAGRFQLMHFMQMDVLIETRQQQKANDDFLKQYLP